MRKRRRKQWHARDEDSEIELRGKGKHEEICIINFDGIPARGIGVRRARRTWHACQQRSNRQICPPSRITTKYRPKENSMDGLFPGTCASMLAIGLCRSNSLYAVSHRMSASRRSGRERPKRNRLRGFALESWSYNYDVTLTLPKSVHTECEESHDPR